VASLARRGRLPGCLALAATLTLALGYAYVRNSQSLGDEGTFSCGPGFTPHAKQARCCAIGTRQAALHARCGDSPECLAPLVKREADGRCEAPAHKIRVAQSNLVLSASDWESEGRVAPMNVHTAPFLMDAFEITVGQAICSQCALPDPKRFAEDDLYRAMSPLTRNEAMRVCAGNGGRLPTESEWVAAALSGKEGSTSGPTAQRYPWGETGAVCRRDAWGLVTGPCGFGAALPDSVLAHPDGASKSGIHNLSANVSEWVIDPERPNEGITRGGSFASSFAAELRIWKRQLRDPETRDVQIGARCVYAAD
jgi:formylglycine-generating enzyme